MRASDNGVLVTPDSQEGRIACSVCGDTGKVIENHKPERIQVGVREVMELGGYSTHPCECRKNLPPREGVAKWWTTESIHSESLTLSLHSEIDVDITIDAEVPMSEANYRVHNRGNRYYPTMIQFNSKTLMVDDARSLAAALIRAADIAEAHDAPDTDTCGHWYPCDCRKVPA